MKRTVEIPSLSAIVNWNFASLCLSAGSPTFRRGSAIFDYFGNAMFKFFLVSSGPRNLAQGWFNYGFCRKAACENAFRMALAWFDFFSRLPFPGTAAGGRFEAARLVGSGRRSGLAPQT
jgi:hypothetical protein